MMSKAKNQLDLSRRALGYFLVFGLLAITWFMAGLPTISQAVIANQVESACVTRLGKVATRVLSCHLESPGELQSLIVRMAGEGSLAYCAVVSPEGRYLAHSVAALTGQPAPEPSGSIAQWGDVRRIRFVDDESRILREYSTPLKRGDRLFGILRMAVRDPSLVTGMLAAAEHA